LVRIGEAIAALLTGDLKIDSEACEVATPFSGNALSSTSRRLNPAPQHRISSCRNVKNPASSRSAPIINDDLGPCGPAQVTCKRQQQLAVAAIILVSRSPAKKQSLSSLACAEHH
jgi:hypothetical protein